MSRILTALVSGILFGIGLAVSQMTNPAKVIGFLDVTGNWDPSLAFVMGVAVGVSAIAVQVARRRPLLAATMSSEAPPNGIDGRLVLGASIFGIGWGLAGFCPGPALASLVTGSGQVLLFVASMIAGMGLFRLFSPPDSPSLGNGIRNRSVARMGAILLSLGLVAGCASTPDDESASSATPIDYAGQIKPVLEANCYSCHGPLQLPSGKLRLDQRAGALKGGRSGRPAIIPGEGAESPLVIAISGGNGERWRAMPPRGKPLRAEQVELIRLWIDEGARFETRSKTTTQNQIPK